ncbi:MAG: sigma-54-dependent Fis family transcriptional regulator [bacterium]|nr:sigma-54-dependent Fis family transcriptional regulator [bacterium]
MKSSHSILVVEDEQAQRELLSKILSLKNYDVSEAESATAARKKLSVKKFDLILLDLTLPDANGLDILEEISLSYRNRVIIVSGTGSIDNAVEAMRKGAFDFLSKPVEHNVLMVTIRKALEVNRKLDDYQTLKENLHDARIDNIICNSATMTEVRKKAMECALSNKTVLITGETGTGKELIARAIHNESARKGNPFVTVNCASIPISLAESELFGFERGAFTGADKPYKGKFMLADKGTIFLDEIGEMHLEIQPKLLRVLESGEIYHLKGSRAQTPDIRVIAATNQNLKNHNEVEFRRDLYYRLQQVEICIPALRKRKADIIPLVLYFLSINNIASSKQVTNVDKEAQKMLINYNWPGNVRELKNTVAEMMAFIQGNTVKSEDLPTRIRKHQGVSVAEDNVLSLEDVERTHIRNVLILSQYNIQKTAKLLGIGRPSLYRKMERFNLKKPPKV